ncbi:tetratricopeptide repeat protein [Streptomyces sp. NPDC059479]|uniref:PIN domain-containing protein n=1 Tax=Streptomyces sp. NPDC059479 TaxID=3346848 RepID=UPI0036862F93
MKLFSWMRRKDQTAAPRGEGVPAEVARTVSAGPGAVAAGGAITGSVIGDHNTVTYIEKQYVTDGGATRGAGRSGFDQALATLPPVSQEEARQLRDRWPDVEVVVKQLPTGRTARKKIFEQWAKHEPQWLANAPVHAFPWLAQLASAYDARTASFSFYDRSVREGGYPRDLLVVRAALHAETMTPGSARSYLAAHQDLDSVLVRAVQSVLDGDRPAVLDHLDQWTAPDDSAQALQLLLRTDALIGQDLTDQALPALREADIARFPQLGLVLAQALLQRATRRATRRKLADAQEALAVALRVRNARREWFGDSAAAVVLGMQAAVFSQDLSTAWALSQPAPEGDADAHEAEDPRVQEESALIAALTGREHRARELLGVVTRPFAKAQVLAVLEERRAGSGSEDERVAEAWQRAWDAAQPGPEQLMAAMGLVESGRNLPEIAHLRGDYPEAVADLERFARAVSGAAGGDLSVLRANANQSPITALKLAQRYQQLGDLERAAATLQEAAEQWRDAQLMTMAARAYQQARDYAKAKECAESALRIAGPGWAAQGAMYELLVETESAAGNWERATDAAIVLLGLDPHNLDARWALVRCYITRAQPDEAWRTLTELGEAAAPRRRDEALLWVQLGARHSADPQFVGRALELMQNWPQDEELLGGFLGALLWRTTTTQPMTSRAAELLREASSDYLERFPDSVYFRALDATDPQAALEEIGESLRREHEDEDRREIRERINQGKLPIGMLASMSGRSYTEVCVRLTAELPGLFASDPTANALEAGAIQAALTQRVVVDTSAAVSLALLEPGAAERLIGSCHSIVTTDQIVGDAFHALESFALRSNATLVWNEDESRAALHVAPDEQVSALRRVLERAADIVRSLPRVARPELRALPGLAVGRSTEAWLTALDLAKEHGLVLWCDDRALRMFARSAGVPAFGTLALIDACQREETMASQEALALRAELLRHFYMDIPFSSDLYGFAAQADGWHARGVAAAIARPTAWSDPRGVVRLVLDAVAQIIDSEPDHASAWLAAAYAGLWRATLPSHRFGNLQKLSVQALTRPWVSDSSLPFLLAGLHNGAAEVQSGDGPLMAALARYYEALIEQMGHPWAGTALMNLFSHAAEADKSAAARIVLTHRDE